MTTDVDARARIRAMPNETRWTRAEETEEESVDALCARLDATTAAVARETREMMTTTGATNARRARDEKLRETHARVVTLNRACATASARASAYESRVMGEKTRALRAAFERFADVARPREKFRFKSRGTTRRRSGGGEEGEEEGRGAVGETATSGETAAGETAAAAAVVDDDGPGIRDRSNETIVATDATEDDDYALERLTDCDVFVFGACRALRAYDLKRCRVYALAVSGSAHVENIVDSVFCVAARQLRAHCARRTRFHARVASRPVVEDSRDVAFAPRVALEDAHASADDELLRKHGLDVENGLWREVDDFLWLRAGQSPHWRELEEDARDADARDVRARAARAREGL